MLHHRVFAACVIAGSMIEAASAQDCDRFPWACQGPWAPPPIFAPRPYPGYPPREAAPPPQPSWRGAPAAPAAPARPREAAPLDPASARQYAAIYARIDDEPFPIPAVRLSDVDPAFLRRTVQYPTSEPAGTIIIDAGNHFLYLILGSGRAVRYGVGVGRQGFGWSGVANIHDKQQWPDWYPPREMLARQPELMRQMSELRSGIGMPGGPRNPLGARALYLWQGNKDTLFRIHGTVEPWTIGRNVSSGCIRMLNQDVIDLFEHAPVGAKVVVLQSQA
jgi:lipoprotein-anchoring transpeptidase ErfK/SrfK